MDSAVVDGFAVHPRQVALPRRPRARPGGLALEGRGLRIPPGDAVAPMHQRAASWDGCGEAQAARRYRHRERGEDRDDADAPDDGSHRMRGGRAPTSNGRTASTVAVSVGGRRMRSERRRPERGRGKLSGTPALRARADQGQERHHEWILSPNQFKRQAAWETWSRSARSGSFRSRPCPRVPDHHHQESDLHDAQQIEVRP